MNTIIITNSSLYSLSNNYLVFYLISFLNKIKVIINKIKYNKDKMIEVKNNYPKKTFTKLIVIRTIENITKNVQKLRKSCTRKF